MNQSKKKLNVFSRKTLTFYHVSSNCDVLDRKMKIYVLLLVCHTTNTLKFLVAIPTYSRHILNLLLTCDNDDNLKRCFGIFFKTDPWPNVLTNLHLKLLSSIPAAYSLPSVDLFYKINWLVSICIYVMIFSVNLWCATHTLISPIFTVFIAWSFYLFWG